MAVAISKGGSRSGNSNPQRREQEFLQVGKEMIEVSDYSLKSSADGSTELSVTIKGNVNVFETSANLIM